MDKSVAKTFSGLLNLQGAPSSKFNNSCHPINSLDQRKSFKNATSASSRPVQAYFPCAGLVILNHQPITETNFCGNLNNFCYKTALQSTPEATSSEVKSCKVLLENIFSFCDAGKLMMLRSGQEKTHNTCAHHTNEEILLSHMQVKPPIAWAN